MTFTRKGELFRDPQKGKIAGVCAGVSEYFGIELWLVRILVIAGFLLSGSFFLIAYVAAWFILEKKPKGVHVQYGIDQSQGKGWQNYDESLDEKIEVKAKVWQSGKPPKEALGDIKQKFAKIEGRLRCLETYVTSKEFQLNREISRL